MVGWKKMAISRFRILTPKLTCECVGLHMCFYQRAKITATVYFH